MADMPSAANNVMRNLGKIWDYVEPENDNIPSNPVRVAMKRRWYEERKNQPIIDDLAAWKEQIDGLKNTLHATFYRLLLATGLRKSEAAGLKWEHVHNDHIHLPMTKNGKPFDLPITPLHHRILAEAKGLDDVYVFPAMRGKRRPMTTPHPITWACHAHRRTFLTIAVGEAKLLSEVAGRLTNHTPRTVTEASYVKLTYEPLVEPMQKSPPCSRKWAFLNTNNAALIRRANGAASNRRAVLLCAMRRGVVSYLRAATARTKEAEMRIISAAKRWRSPCWFMPCSRNAAQPIPTMLPAC